MLRRISEIWKTELKFSKKVLLTQSTVFRRVVKDRLSIVFSTLREKCPYSEIFWSVFAHIRTEYREIFRIAPYSVRMRENTDQKNSKYGHFSPIFKALMKDSATSIDIYSVKKKFKNGRKRTFGKEEDMPKFIDSSFILDNIHTVFSDDSDTLRKKINLDFSPEVSP